MSCNIVHGDVCWLVQIERSTR